MKMNIEIPNIEISGEMSEQLFSIGDPAFIFDVLRNKMYSDPILAICREISCNARDAHREAKKPNLPIEITLPTPLDPFYRVKDYGPGIDPDRMSNVFIKYGVSTKRETNDLLGSMGCGAKTPFSYSDSFTIITIVDNQKYNYACFIDETKIGKLLLMSQEATTEDNGTTIMIPVKNQDFTKFSIATEESTRHWNIKPFIKNGTINYKIYKTLLQSTLWRVATSNKDSNYSYYNSDQGLKIIIDGIEYNVANDVLKKFADASILEALKGFLFLDFDIGELSLAANRESIYFDKATEGKISNRLKLVKKEIIEIINYQIQSFDNYLSANKFYNKDLRSLYNYISSLGPLYWNGVPLYGNSLGMNNTIINFYKAKTLRGMNRGKIKFKQNTKYWMGLEENTKIYFNDTDLTEFHYKHVKKAFEDESIESVQIINLAKNQTFDQLDADFSLIKIGVEMLSTITAGVKVPAKRDYSNKLLIFKGIKSYNNCLTQIPYSDIESDNNKVKVLCLFERGYNYPKSDKHLILDGGKAIYNEALYNLLSVYPEVSFYAVDKETDKDRIKKEFIGYLTLDQFIKDNIEGTYQECLESYNLSQMNTSVIEDIDVDQLKNQITNSKSLFLKKINLFQEINNKKTKGLKVNLYSTLIDKLKDKDIKDWMMKHPELDFSKIEKQCNEKYPLLDRYMNNVKLEHISQYINFIDSL